MQSINVRIGLVFVIALLAGCGSAATPAAPTTVPATAAPTPGGYRALPDCPAIRDAAAQALHTTFTLEEAPFIDPISGESGTACLIQATGTGADFESVPAVMDKLRAILPDWQENPAYAADGPVGTSAAFNRQNDLLTVLVEWQPDPQVTCPPDQPISACPLTPEQHLYFIGIRAAQK